MYIYYIDMREKRVRTKLFNVWLHPKEHEFLFKYAEQSLMTSSDVVRSLIKQLMKQEGVEFKEPKLNHKFQGGNYAR